VFSTEDELKSLQDFINYKLSNNKIIFFNKTRVFYYVINSGEVKTISLTIREKEAKGNCIKAIDVSGIKDHKCVITMQ
jgi:hypothetical protein